MLYYNILELWRAKAGDDDDASATNKQINNCFQIAIGYAVLGCKVRHFNHALKYPIMSILLLIPD